MFVCWFSIPGIKTSFDLFGDHQMIGIGIWSSSSSIQDKRQHRPCFTLKFYLKLTKGGDDDAEEEHQQRLSLPFIHRDDDDPFRYSHLSTRLLQSIAYSSKYGLSMRMLFNRWLSTDVSWRAFVMVLLGTIILYTDEMCWMARRSLSYSELLRSDQSDLCFQRQKNPTDWFSFAEFVRFFISISMIKERRRRRTDFSRLRFETFRVVQIGRSNDVFEHVDTLTFSTMSVDMYLPWHERWFDRNSSSFFSSPSHSIGSNCFSNIASRWTFGGFSSSFSTLSSLVSTEYSSTMHHADRSRSQRKPPWSAPRLY